MSLAQVAGLIEYLEEDVRARILSQFSTGALASVLDRLDQDVAADIVQELPAPQQETVVPLLQDREGVEELLTYPEDSAGGRMSRVFVALGPEWTVEESIRALRRERPDSGRPFYLYVVDEDGHLRGLVSLRDLVTTAPNVRIAALMAENMISILTTDDQEAAAERMRHYDLLALPVVDSDGRLRGVITADDVLDVQVEEAIKDIYRMAGLGVKEWAFSPVRESALRRILWLAFNMAWAFAGALIISVFEPTLDRVAALAIFMPIIAGQAGNSGIQTATIVVRSMALGELGERDAMRVLRKEWVLGLIKGAFFGGVLFLVAWLWRAHLAFGVIAGGAMFLNMLVASTTGVIVPMTLRRLGIDPATIAGVFDTMVTDFMGFLIYLGLATLFVSYLV
jgi:magnesium transporter